MLIWLNGEIRSATEAVIGASCAGLTLGWGVFSTIGVWQGRAFAMERHLSRLRHDAGVADIEIGFDDAVLQAAVDEVIARNGVREGYLRLTVTRRADGRWNQTPGSDFSILAASRQPLAEKNLRLALSPYRLDTRRPLAGIKTTSYLEHQWMWREATARGFDEAVLCNSQGVLCECARANLFWTQQGESCTPSRTTGCLPGIARSLVLEWAVQAGVAVREGAFSVHELTAADEVFITAATTGPRAVSLFYDSDTDDGRSHRFAAPGALAQLLQARWHRETHSGG